MIIWNAIKKSNNKPDDIYTKDCSGVLWRGIVHQPAVAAGNVTLQPSDCVAHGVIHRVLEDGRVVHVVTPKAKSLPSLPKLLSGLFDRV